MADVTNAALAAKITDFVDAVAAREEEVSVWVSGTADGGPNGDGFYPITDLSGFVHSVASPARIRADATGILGGVLTFATWAELAAYPTTDLVEAYGAKIYNDGGTHTDPVTAAVGVANEGVYRLKKIAPAGWERIANLEAADAEVSATSAAASEVASIASAESFAFYEERPNLLNQRQLNGDLLPDVLSFGTVAKLSLDGRGGLAGVSTGTPGTAGQLRFAHRFLRDDFKSGWATWDFEVASADVGLAAGNTRFIFRNASGTQLYTSSAISGLHAAVDPASPQRFTLTAQIPDDPLIVYVDTDIDVRKATAAAARNFNVRRMNVVDGKVGGFRPPLPHSVNHFVDPSYAGERATVFDALSVIDSGESVLRLTQDGTLRQVIYEFPATGIFAPGNALKFEAEIYANGVPNASTTTGDITWTCYNAAGTQLAVNQVNAAVGNRWHRRRNRLLVPALTTKIALRFAKRAPATIFDLRHIHVTTTHPRAKEISATEQSLGGGSSAAVFVSPTGNDLSPGTRGAPLATLAQALAAIGGSGLVHVLPGDYGPSQQFDPALIQGRVEIVGAAGTGAYPVIRMAAPLTGITKTAGRTNVYQATVAGLTWANINWIWQDNVSDPRTLIPTSDRHPAHKGRTHRLSSTKIVRVTDSSSLAAALTEMDSATTTAVTAVDGTTGSIVDPRCYYDEGTSTLYFTVVAGTDALAASIYVPAAVGLIADGAHDANGVLALRNLEVRYGGVDLASFSHAEMSDATVIGAAANCVDYSNLIANNVEVAGSGSLGGVAGDGLNGHIRSSLKASNIYGHDCHDDSESAHEGGGVRMNGAYFEYNGGSAVCPATGCDAEYRNVESFRNVLRTDRKLAAFQTAGEPTEGVDTSGVFINCTDRESLNSFQMYPTAGANMRVEKCRSINPVEKGFIDLKMSDCGGVGNGLLKQGCTVANTALVA